MSTHEHETPEILTTDEALSMLRRCLKMIGETPDGVDDERAGKAAGDALWAALQLDQMLSAGESLPTAWAAGQRLEIVHARPSDFGCQVAVFVGGRELMTEDRAFSYVNVDPGADARTPEQWQAEADDEADPMRGHSPAFTEMVRQAYKQNAPRG